jgi:hypothetical protein
MTDPLAPLRALPRLRLAPIANILDNPPLQVRFWHDLAVQTGLNERQISTLCRHSPRCTKNAPEPNFDPR